MRQVEWKIQAKKNGRKKIRVGDTAWNWGTLFSQTKLAVADSLVEPGMRHLGSPLLKRHYRYARNYYDFNKIVSHLGARFCAASVVGAWVCHGKVCNQRKIPALLRVRLYHWLMCVVFFK